MGVGASQGEDRTSGVKAGIARPVVVLSDQAREIHSNSLVVDGHNDLPWQFRELVDGRLESLDLSQHRPRLHTDIPRLRQGGVGAQFWSAYAPVSTMRRGEAAHVVLEQIDLIRRMVSRYPDVFELALTADDIERIHGAGKIASLIGVEGGHAIENSLGLLRIYHRLGVRYMTLTHADTLDWADSATDEARHGGLSPFGEEVVRSMNRLGMLVDISHVSEETMLDAIRVSAAPVIASHSSAYAVAEHPRNVSDRVLGRIAEQDGVVMVNFFSGFVVPDSAQRMGEMFNVRREFAEKFSEKFSEEAEREKAYEKWKRDNPIDPGTIHHVVDHIEHIARVAGVEHVGLGSDYDGVDTLPRQLEDVSTYPYITQELLNRGFTAEEIRQILGLNLLRVLRKAEQVAVGSGK